MFILQFFILSFGLYSQVFHYVSILESGERISSTWTIKNTKSGFILFLDDEEGTQRIECLANGDVRFMEGWDLDGQKLYEIRADVNAIRVEVQGKKGNRIIKELIRKPNIPFYQPMGLCMQEFILGKEQEQDFYIVDLEALKLWKMVVIKKGFGTRVLMGEHQQVVQTEIRFTGILRNFWKGECDFSLDGRWVYFFGEIDISSPPVKILLSRIEQLPSAN